MFLMVLIVVMIIPTSRSFEISIPTLILFREQIIEVLNKLHRGFYKGQPIMMFFRDDITLENYTALSPKVRVSKVPRAFLNEILATT